MVFFLLCICVFVSFFAIAINVTGYLSVDRECMIFVVKVYGVKAFKIIVQKVNGIFEITINGQNFDKIPKKPHKNINRPGADRSAPGHFSRVYLKTPNVTGSGKFLR